MKKLNLTFPFFFVVLAVQSINISPYISTVIDYHPAPSQFVGDNAYLPVGKTAETVTYEEVLDKVSSVLVGSTTQNGLVVLGAWGGYVTVGFDHTIPNVSGQYDFKVYGNAYYAPNYIGLGGNSEPGIVLVSKDENANGLVDDQWYELAGSEYENAASIHQYQLTYYKPNPLNADVYWKDNKGNEGYVYRNEFHAQASYFPLWTEADSLVFNGTRLPNNSEDLGTSFLLYAYAFGYADNHPNNSDFSNFNIDWAVDSLGNPVHLDGIDFIRVYSGVNQSNGWIGDTSTEIAGIEDLHPQLSGIEATTDDDIKIYPNPVTDYLYVEAEKGANVKIYSLDGALLKSVYQKDKVQQIDFSAFVRGNYIVEIITNNEVKQFKLIKL